MRGLIFALLLSSSFLLAQDSSRMSQDTPKDSKGQVTQRGCVSRFGGDYVLMKTNPAVTYELQATNHIKLSKYLGQRVEVTGKESASLSTSSDTSTRGSNPSPVTLTITSIKTLDKECSEGSVSR
ncbi:MAG: hypothetical protein ABSG02_02910 [Terriglobales bacterium]|jgi:hypothetical protein